MATQVHEKTNIGSPQRVTDNAMAYPLTLNDLKGVIRALRLTIESPDTSPDMKARLADRIAAMQEHNAKLRRMELETQIRVMEIAQAQLPSPSPAIGPTDIQATYALLDEVSAATSDKQAAPEQPEATGDGSLHDEPRGK